MSLPFSIFYFLCSGQGLLLAAIPMKKSNRSTSGILFSLLISLVTLQMFSYGLAYSKLLIHVPHFWGISTIIFFIIPPVFFFAIQSRIRQVTIKWKSLLHLLPALFVFLIHRNFFLRTSAEKIEQLKAITEFVPSLSTTSLIIALIGGIQLIFYAVATYRLLKGESSKERSLPFEQKSLYLFLTFTALYFVYKLSIFSGLGYYSILCYSCKSLMGLSIYLMAFVLFVSNPFKSNVKYLNSNLTNGFVENLKKRLTELIQKNEVFKDNELNQEKLASQLNCSKHELSQLINEHYGKSFPSFINDFRIEYAAEQIKKDRHAKLWHIGIDAGFSNRVSFNQAFKKVYKVSPSDFRDQFFGE